MYSNLIYGHRLMLAFLMNAFMQFTSDLLNPSFLIPAAHAFILSVLALCMFGLIIRVIALLL
jgi:hypothetical protein